MDQSVSRSAAPALAIVAVLGLTLATYAQFLGTGFAATDSLPLIETSRLDGFDSVTRLFTTPVMAGSGFTVTEVVYRPFVSLTFGLDYLMWGGDSAGYHISNLALHLVAVGAVWLLLRNLGLSLWASSLGAAVFALHPVVVATVPVIGRRDSVVPVAAFAVSAALLLTAQKRRGIGRAILLGISFLAAAVALLSKESAFVAVALLPVLLAAWSAGRDDHPSWRGTARAVALSVPYVVLAAVLFVFRLTVLRGMGGMPDADLGFVDFYRYGILIGAYTRDLLWAFAPMAPATREIWLRLAAAIVVALALTVIWLPRRHGALAVAGALWVIGFGIFCAVLKIATLGWLAYFSLLGLALLVAAGVEGAVSTLSTTLATRPTLTSDRPLFPRSRWSTMELIAMAGSTALLIGLLSFAVSAIGASALFRSYSQWRVAGDVEQRYMQALTTCVGAAPDATVVNLQKVPANFDDGRPDTVMLGVTLIEEYTARSALRLAYPDRPLTVRAASVDTLREGAAMQFTCSPRPGGIEFAASY
jgi:hypothetical protein